MTPSPLLTALRATLAAAGDPARARAQAAYMKSAMPFHGVANPEVRRLARALFADHPLPTPAAWRDDVAALWDGATFREERYAALALAADARARPHQGLPRTARAAAPPDARDRAAAALGLYERLITSGAWWDLVDELAAHHVGPLLAAHPDLVAPTLRAWASGPDLWLRRAAILAQLGRKGATDTALLAELIAPALDSPIFWLRKAIGWALRDYARTNPAWVRAFVADAGERLSPLSRREALKHLAAP